MMDISFRIPSNEDLTPKCAAPVSRLRVQSGAALCGSPCQNPLVQSKSKISIDILQGDPALAADLHDIRHFFDETKRTAHRPLLTLQNASQERPLFDQNPHFSSSLCGRFFRPRLGRHSVPFWSRFQTTFRHLFLTFFGHAAERSLFQETSPLPSISFAFEAPASLLAVISRYLSARFSCPLRASVSDLPFHPFCLPFGLPFSTGIQENGDPKRDQKQEWKKL